MVNQSADSHLGGPVWSLDSAVIPKFFSAIYICTEGEKTSLTLTSNDAFHNFDTNKEYTRRLSLYFTYLASILGYVLILCSEKKNEVIS